MDARHLRARGGGSAVELCEGVRRTTMGRDVHRTMPYLRARRIGAAHFLMNRLPNVRTEMSLHVLAYT
jgi:hypothetical protein